MTAINIDENLISSIFESGRKIRETLNSVCFFYKMSHIQMQILKFMDSRGGKTMNEISSFLHVKPPTVTPIINELVNSKMLKRMSDVNDRRLIKVELTKKGKKFIDDTFKKVSVELKKIFSKLDDRDKKELINILNKIK